MATIRYPQESLSEALLALLRQQVSAFLIFWIVINVPAVCQYHSMMTLWDVAPDEHHVHGQAQDHTQHDQHDQNQTECALHDHTIPSHLMLLDAIPSIMPNAVITLYEPQEHEHFVAVDEWPPELIIPPPEQPPRSA